LEKSAKKNLRKIQKYKLIYTAMRIDFLENLLKFFFQIFSKKEKFKKVLKDIQDHIVNTS